MTTDIDIALEALGDATRRRIISRLASGPLDVSALSDGMPVGRTAISMHLRVLKKKRVWSVIDPRAPGVFTAEPDALQRLRNHLTGIGSVRWRRFKRLPKRAERTSRCS
ncbi:MAG: ArsR family transcriptional regulator [Thermomicrobiales bacterium]